MICDVPGSGLSPKHGNDEQSVPSMAKDAISILHKLGVDPRKTILIGHSMGGMVACELASKNAFAGVVLLGPVHPSPGAAQVFANGFKW